MPSKGQHSGTWEGKRVIANRVVFPREAKSGVCFTLVSDASGMSANDIVEVNGDGVVGTVGGTTATAKFIGIAVESIAASAKGKIMTMGVASLTVTSGQSNVTAGDAIVSRGIEIMGYASGTHANTQRIGIALEDIANGTAGLCYISAAFQGGE